MRTHSSKQVHALYVRQKFIHGSSLEVIMLDWSNLQTLVNVYTSKMKRKKTLWFKFMFYVACTFK